MLRLRCPFCGLRDETEFRYRGDAEVQRPAAEEGEEAFFAYVYLRRNEQGWHQEWWQHVGGCRQTLKVTRHTLSHEIRSVEVARQAAAGDFSAASGESGDGKG